MNEPGQIITTVDLLRHGECEGGDIYRGRIDVALTERGWQQMQASVDGLGVDTTWQRIVSSPLRRCGAFAESVARQRQIPLEQHTAWQELDFGDWDGRSMDDVWQSDPSAVQAFYDNPASAAPPGGESLQQLQDRLIPAWHSLLQSYSGQQLLLVLHGGSIRILLAWLLQMPLAAVLRLEVPYAGLSRVRVVSTPADGRYYPSLVFLNRPAGEAEND